MGAERRGSHPHERVLHRRLAVGVSEVKEWVEWFFCAFDTGKTRSDRSRVHLREGGDRKDWRRDSASDGVAGCQEALQALSGDGGIPSR